MNYKDCQSVLFISPVGTLGGAERVLLSLIRALQFLEAKYIVQVSCLGDGRLIEEIEKLGCSVCLNPLPERLSRLGDSPAGSQGKYIKLVRLMISVPSFLSSIYKWKKKLHREDYFLIHSNGFKTHVISALATPKYTPILWHMHDFLGERPLMRILLKMVWRPGIQAIAISKAVADDFSKHLPNCPVRVWHNTVDCNKFQPRKIDGHWLDVEAGFTGDFQGARIGLVATYARWKGHDTFLRACQLLSRKFYNDVRFYIVGGPVYQTVGSQWSLKELRDKIKEFKLDSFVGIIPFQLDTEKVYQSFDIVVHASTLREPFGLVIAEAMACGKPVVAALQGGAAEIGEDNVNCVGHEPGNPSSLASKIEGLVLDKNRREQLGANARDKILVYFSHENTLNNWQRLLREILEK